MIAATFASLHPVPQKGSAEPSVSADLARDTAPLSWQRALAQAITDPDELIATLGLSADLLPAARRAAKAFPLRVPRSFVARMQRGDRNDPLLRQVLPLDCELETRPGYSADPVGDLGSRATAGVLHKYHGRALLIATGACGVHCRYCFRRHFPYVDESALGEHWTTALDYLRNDTSISEVILSGGDPLSLNDRRLQVLTDGLQTIAHIRRLRIHTRQPIVLPERIDNNFCAWLTAVPLQKVIVLHVNHANEIDDAVRGACEKLARCGVTLLNQSVLLAGVNDQVERLTQLSETLFAAGVIPYYLHLLDRVHGAAHFEVSAARAVALVNEMAAHLPGYLVPKLVREVAGAQAKMPVSLL